MSLSTLISAATQLGGGLARGQGQVLDQRRQQQLQDYQISRQQQQDQLRQQLEDRQQSQLEQQTAIRNRLQGVIPSSTPVAKDPLTRIQGDAGSEPIPISRDARLAKMEAPDDPNAPQSAVPLPNVDLGAVHQAELDKSRRFSGVPGKDINFDDSQEAYKQRQQNTREDQKLQEANSRQQALFAQQQSLNDQKEAQQTQTQTAKEKADAQRQIDLEDRRFGHEKTLVGLRGQEARTTNANKPLGGGRASSPQELAQIGIAINQANAAKTTMDAFEDDLLNHRVSIGPLDMEAANKVLRGGFGSGMTDAALSSSFGNPRLRDYVLGAKAIANADRLIAKRGGSQQMVNTEQLLSSVGPNAKPASIMQAKTMREATIAGLAKSAQALGWTTGQTGETADPHAALRAHLKGLGYSDQQISDYLAAHPNG